MRFQIKMCRCRSQFAASADNLPISFTMVDSATAQFNYTLVLLIIYGFPTLFRNPQILLLIPPFCLFLERFWMLQGLSCLCVKSKTVRKIAENNISADSAANLILATCGTHLQCTECTAWPHNIKNISSPIFFEVLWELAISQFGQGLILWALWRFHSECWKRNTGQRYL